jgi:pyridoxamine 5'-phosphate oxidase
MPDPVPGGPDLSSIREDYGRSGLHEEDLDADPLVMLRRWMHDAIVAGLYDPTAMVVSTVSPDGLPTSRMVLCKGVETDGVTFYSNYGSAKARDLAANGACALLFPWHAMQRQVRLEGTATRVPSAVSDAYFASRPRPSQLAAWASEQSAPVGSREALEAAYDEVARRFEGVEVPRPDFWGGYLVRPSVLELWQGRSGRLHDRLRYRRTGEGWVVGRLAP